MAQYKEITITEAGEALILKQIMAGTAPLDFTAIAIGDGELSEGADIKTISALVNEKKRLTVETFSRAGAHLWITARLATDSITEGIYHREIGVFVGNTLFAYGNTGADYDYIPPAGENAAVSKTIRLQFKIGSAKVQFTELDSSDFVTYEGLAQRMKEIAVEINVDQTFDPESANAQSGKALADLQHADIVWDVNKMFPSKNATSGTPDTWREFYAISALREFFYNIDAANGDTDPETGFTYSKKMMVPGLKIRYFRNSTSGYMPDPFWCTATWSGGNIDWTWKPGGNEITDDFSNPVKWSDDIPISMMDLHLDGGSTDSNGKSTLHVTPEEKAKWNEAGKAIQTTQFGADAAKDIVWKSAELIAPPKGRLKSITVSGAASASDGLSVDPLYLLLLDYDDNILAASSNTVTPAAGTDAIWTFDGVTLPKLKHIFLAVSTTSNAVTAGAAGGVYSSEYTLGTRIYKAAGGGQYGTLKAAFCTEWTLEEHLNDRETNASIYAEFSDLLTDGYSAPCLESMCQNMPAGSRAQIAIDGIMSGEDAPLNQDGILEISKAADLAKITFTAAPNDGEAIFNAEAIYINTCSSSGLGTWKKIALADVE